MGITKKSLMSRSLRWFTLDQLVDRIKNGQHRVPLIIIHADTEDVQIQRRRLITYLLGHDIEPDRAVYDPYDVKVGKVILKIVDTA